MKKGISLLLSILLVMMVFSASACKHSDEFDDLQLNYNQMVPPTETEDGHTGPGTCPYCNAVIDPGHVIPATGIKSVPAGDSDGDSGSGSEPQDAPVAQAATPTPTPDPTQPPTQAPTDVPTAAPTQPPTQAPTDVPTTPPTQPPTQAPTAVPDQQGSGGSSQTPVPVMESGQENNQSSTQGGGTETNASSQNQQATPEQNNGKSGGGGGGGQRRRDKNRYPIFSTRFPWRRLFLNPPQDLPLAPAAGILIWPEEAEDNQVISPLFSP